MDIKEARKRAGLTQRELSLMLDVPLDVVKSWNSGRRKPPEWAKKLVVEKLNRIAKRGRIMRMYEVKKATKEFQFKNRKKIETFCTLSEGDDTCEESIGKYNTFEAAIEECKKYQPRCIERSNAGIYYEIEEYVVEEYDADEDGEFVEGSDYESVYNFKWNEETENIDVTEDKRFF